MSNIVPIHEARMPAAMKNRLAGGVATNRNYEDGVTDSFPRLSIKGKVFRIRMNGQETPLIDQQTRQVIPYLDVILVNASRTISKAFYEKGFSDTEASFEAPTCWSLDSVRPDPSVANKQSPTCQGCPKNVFGSKITDAGKAAKACQDARRVAVTLPGHLNTAEPLIFMLRVPQTSLKNLKGYAQKLERNGWEPAACVTRLSFDYKEAYPKLEFHFVDGLNDAEYDQVVDMAESSYVASMLNAPDFDAAATGPTVPDSMDDTTTPRQRQAAPVMETDLRAAEPAENVQPQAATSPVQGVPNTVIELPDGQLFDQATGEFIQRAQPKVEMPAIDPNVVPLPDGRFFHKVTKQFVTGPEVGAKPVGEVKEPPKRPQRAARGKKAEAQPASPPTQAEQAAPAVTGETKAQPVAENNPQDSQATASAPNGPVTPGVVPATAVLDDILKSVIPTRQ